MSVDEIKQQIKLSPISMIVSHYISLKKTGTNYLGLCPFHADSKPSLTVSDQKGMFKCFACNTGGDAITFAQKYKNIEFIEALKEVAGILNISTDSLDRKEEKDPKLVMGQRVLSSAVKIYRKIAMSDNCGPYLQFAEERKISAEILEKFQIGFAPATNPLIHYLKTIPPQDQSFAIKVALELGLIREDFKKNLVDTFNDRIMFPIWDQFGHPVGFTSRRIREDQHAKYMNSKESFLFNKRNILYGFHFARTEIRDSKVAILVEGNMDTIAMHKAGFTNTIGTQGTAVTEKQLSLIKSLIETLFLCMDNDNAGMEAAQKTNQLFMETLMLPRYLDLSPAKDPDDFLKVEGGTLELRQRMEKAPYFIDYLIDKMLSELDLENLKTDDKIKFLHRVFGLLTPLKMDLKATERVGLVAKRLGLFTDPQHLLKAYEEQLREQKNPTKTFKPALDALAQKITQEKNSESLSSSAKAVPKTASSLTLSEKLFLQEIILHPQCISEMDLDELLDFITHTEVKHIVQWLKNLYLEVPETEYIDTIKNHLDRSGFSIDVKETIGASLFNFVPQRLDEKQIKKMVSDLTKKMKEEFLKNQRAELITKKDQAITPDEKRLAMEQIVKLEKELFSLKKNTEKNTGR